MIQFRHDYPSQKKLASEGYLWVVRVFNSPEMPEHQMEKVAFQRNYKTEFAMEKELESIKKKPHIGRIEVFMLKPGGQT